MAQPQPSKQPYQQQKQSQSNQGVEFLSSSFLAKADYDSGSMQLTVYMKSGSTLTYWPVYPATWTAFQQAPSAGSFYAHAIRGKFQNVAITKPLMPSSLPRSKKK